MAGSAGFEELGNRYTEQLERGLRLTGETATYFATARIARMREIAAEHALEVRTLLDFGCGTGTAFPLLREAFPSARLVGYEPARSLRDLARAAASKVGGEVLDQALLNSVAFADLVYCNGVFHHIALPERIAAAASFARALRPGGLGFVWENSPYNPGTRLVMSRVPFDDGAVLLSPNAVRLLYAASGMSHVQTEFHFVFPRALRFARFLEPRLRSLPLGGQYVVVGRRD